MKIVITGGGGVHRSQVRQSAARGRHVVIRPLIYCEERDLAAYAELKQFPIIPCNLCGSQDGLKRNEMKALLREWEKRHPGRVETMLNSLKHVRPSHLLDRGAFDFDRLPPSRAAVDPEL